MCEVLFFLHMYGKYFAFEFFYVSYFCCPFYTKDIEVPAIFIMDDFAFT